MSIRLCLLPDYKLRVTNYHHVFLSLMECGLKVWDQRSHSSSELLFATRCTSNQSEPLLRSILLIKKKKENPRRILKTQWEKTMVVPRCYYVPDTGTHPFSMPARFIPTVLPSGHTLRLPRRMENRMGKSTPCHRLGARKRGWKAGIWILSIELMRGL